MSTKSVITTGGSGGAAGTNGTNGTQGIQGIQGIQGVTGATGAAGGSGGAHTAKRYARAGMSSRNGSTDNTGDTMVTLGGVYNGGKDPTTTHGPANEMHNDGSADWVGGYNGALMYCIGTNLQFWYNGYVTSLSDCRFFAGLSNTVGQTWPASDSPSGKFAMFRFSSIASDTNFQCITSDGSTLTVVDSGVAPVANTGNVFAIEFVDSTPAVNFYIDGALVATITTHLPGNGVLVAYQAGVSSHVANTSLCGFSLVQVWSDR